MPRLSFLPLLLALMLFGAGSACQGTSPPAATPSSVQSRPAAPAAAVASSVVTPAPNVSPTPVPVAPAAALGSPTPARSELIVANAGGDSVSIRRSPGGERIRSWPEQTELVDLAEEQEADGRAWKKVADPDGNQGWVAAEFVAQAADPARSSAAPLGPATTPTATASATAPTATALRRCSRAPRWPFDPRCRASGRAEPQDANRPESHPLKGATIDQGEKIYYLPNSPSYASARPEVCFSNGGEARDAGAIRVRCPNWADDSAARSGSPSASVPPIRRATERFGTVDRAGDPRPVPFEATDRRYTITADAWNARGARQMFAACEVRRKRLQGCACSAQSANPGHRDRYPQVINQHAGQAR